MLFKRPSLTAFSDKPRRRLVAIDASAPSGWAREQVPPMSWVRVDRQQKLQAGHLADAPDHNALRIAKGYGVAAVALRVLDVAEAAVYRAEARDTWSGCG